MSLLRVSAAVMLAVTSRSAHGVAQGDTLLIEIAAARAMQAHQYAKGSLGLDPRFGAPGHAPGVANQLRPASRTDALARAIGATVRTYSEASACTERRPCRLTGVAAHVMLSQPSIEGDTATITGTIRQNSPSARQPQDYETLLLVLVRRGANWAVIQQRKLGIS